MSLTLWKVPQELQPTYNQVIIVATSSYQTEVNYQLVSEIWCRGENVTKMKTPVNPEGYVVVDLHKHLENRITFDFNYGATGFQIATQSFASYSVVFYDEFREIYNFIDNQYNLIGATAYIGFTSLEEPNFDIGDEIYVSQDVPYTHASYNGVHTILNITQSGPTWSVITDVLFAGNTPVEGGTITLANYGLTTLPINNLTIWENGTATSSTSFPEKYVFNGVLNFEDFITWNYDEWEATGSSPSSAGKFFTNCPNGFEIDIDGTLYLNMYMNKTNELRTAKIKTPLGTYSISNANYVLSDTTRFQQINVSPSWLYNQGWISSSGGTIEVWIENNLGYETVAKKTFTITNNCSIYDKQQIIFMDKMGSFVSYTFNKVNRETRSINRTDYQQVYGSYAPSTQNWSYNTWDRGRKTLDTIVLEQWTLNSDWVNQKTSDYLMELFESPEVYWLKPNGNLTAINLTVQSVERKQIINEQLINYVLTFELSNKNMQQRG